MKVIKEGIADGKKFRIVCKNICIDPHENSYNEFIEWDEYAVQMKVLCFWVTIKSFEILTFDNCDCESCSDKDLSLIEAEELFDAIINPYKTN